jgi:hypothetical protein
MPTAANHSLSRTSGPDAYSDGSYPFTCAPSPAAPPERAASPTEPSHRFAPLLVTSLPKPPIEPPYDASWPVVATLSSSIASALTAASH